MPKTYKALFHRSGAAQNGRSHESKMGLTSILRARGTSTTSRREMIRISKEAKLNQVKEKPK